MEQQKHTKPDLKIPQFLEDAIKVILLKGLSVEHIFMKSQLNTRVSVELLKQEIDKGLLLNLSSNFF